MAVQANRSALASAAGTCRRIAFAAACAGLLGACGSGSASKTTYLNTARVAGAIERSILSQRHLKATVVCPAKVVQKPGRFPCIATTVNPKHPHKTLKTAFVVTIHNDKGYVTYVGR